MSLGAYRPSRRKGGHLTAIVLAAVFNTIGPEVREGVTLVIRDRWFFPSKTGCASEPPGEEVVT